MEGGRTTGQNTLRTPRPEVTQHFGRSSSVYLSFLILGFPVGLLILDCCMFLEPFGLLTILPFPPWMRQFIPAYKATRVIFEVIIESVPQSLLQGYIYVIVIMHVNAGTATPNELAMMEFSSALPKSILISTLATLKTFHSADRIQELVHCPLVPCWLALL